MLERPAAVVLRLVDLVMGMKPREYFELQSASAAVAPKVDFSAPAKKP